jgi:glycosyltransferase involved in cell wall biosynthesis
MQYMISAPNAGLVDEAGLPDSSQAMPDLDEIQGMHGEQFVRSAYRMLLAREPDGEGILFYRRRLLDGVPKIQILLEIAASKEARELAVNPPGLVRARILSGLSQLPLVGLFAGRILGVDGGNRYETRLRAVEELLHADFQEAEFAGVTRADERSNLRALIANSDLFDAAWYKQQAPDVRIDSDLIDHFLTCGGVEGRSASEKFDSGMYLTRYFDVRRSGMNPLVHFLTRGKRDGRHSFTVAEARQYRGQNANNTTSQKIHCLKVPEVSSEVAVFITDSADGTIKPYVAHHIAALKNQGIGVILVIAASRPVGPLAPETLSMVCGLFLGEGPRDDFAVLAHILRLYPILFSASILFLLDDSVFGPLNAAKFASMIGQIRSSAADMIELKDKSDNQNPLHAYFRALGSKALASVAFLRFVEDLELRDGTDPTTKADGIELLAQLRAQGLKVLEPFAIAEAAAESYSADNTLYKWKKFVGMGFPFVGMAALRQARAGAVWPEWLQFLESEGCDTNLLESTLTTFVLPDDPGSAAPGAHFHGAAALVKRPRPNQSFPLRVAFIGPWNFDGALGFASRGYMSALWHTEFLLNVHPIRHPFHHQHRIAPTVDSRSFSDDADLVVVNLNPDEWPGLLTADHWEIISRSRKIVGAWACEEEKIPECWHPAIDTVDAIWAPSRYSADLFDRSTRVPVEVVPYSVAVGPLCDENSFSLVLRSKLSIARDQHIIISCLTPSDHPERQNVSGLTAAYELSGLFKENWFLIICVGNPLDLKDEAQQLQDRATRTPGVIQIDAPRDPAMRGALLNLADIYASPHRSEFSGLTIAEAMSFGKSVVATDFGGGTDVLDATCGFPVPYKLRAIPDGLCAEVDNAVFASALRKAAGKIISGDGSIGQAARERICLHNSPREIAHSMRRAAATLLGIE